MAMARTLSSVRLPWFIPTNLAKLTKDGFVYVAEWVGATVLGAGATVPVQVQIQADSYFETVLLTGNVSSTDNTTTPSVANPPILVSMLDSGSGRQLQSNPALWGNIMGTAQLPGFLPFPKLLAPSATLTITLQNLDGVNARNVRIALVGFKVFGFTGSMSSVGA